MSGKPADGKARIQTGKHEVSGVWVDPTGDRKAVLILAHGAALRRDHPSMTALADALAGTGMSVFLFNFPYTERGRRVPDPAPTLVRTWLDVWEWAGRDARTSGVPILAGGRSMGGRMATLAAAQHPEAFTPAGLVLFAYPLHPPGHPEKLRVAHLGAIRVPMLFLSGTRDSMVTSDVLEGEVKKLGKRGRLHWLEGADHGFHVLKRSGRTDEQARAEAVAALEAWMTERVV